MSHIYIFSESGWFENLLPIVSLKCLDFFFCSLRVNDERESSLIAFCHLKSIARHGTKFSQEGRSLYLLRVYILLHFSLDCTQVSPLELGFNVRA